MSIGAVAWMYEETLARPFVVTPPRNSARPDAEARRSAEATDETLMRSVAMGDEAAFRRLAARHAARTLALSRRMLANAADADEVLQEAMLRVWVNAPHWRAEAAFKTWLYRVVVNLCLNRQRHKSFAPLDDAAEVPDPSPSALASLERQEADAAVARAIAALPDRQRAAIVLTYYEDLSNAEAASVLETTVSSVEALLVRAKRTLRAELRAQSDDSGSRT
ncbi:RNA polymerase, sigma-24 subunit, ECF subfamily [Rhodomicrobium vannielii ATCC 17100]|uniref:RNA polymerase sigma factor n=1 Tax=Rhodomicrobium vannielii (strain ATCC 17100 / DSM 162 / LMG 4299 / NCIMB 10020 / ATH 3.1.1) TaxID=648757 RepID=E3I3I5_RHOVT|nr:RNA polymerase sigma factor [Rhodomicrobium vannielii]ADP72633.1 RNA polymerase, sigma-24 subunit, ECF subfamily [Rhodomicrobium vannielii ATCC 17100]